jgi:hypothetical protein
VPIFGLYQQTSLRRIKNDITCGLSIVHVNDNAPCHGNERLTGLVVTVPTPRQSVRAVNPKQTFNGKRQAIVEYRQDAARITKRR